MSDELIARARRNLLTIRGELAAAKDDIDDPRTDLEQLLLGVEIVKAEALIAQTELMATIAALLQERGGSEDDPDR